MSSKLNNQLDAHQKDYDNIDEKMENVLAKYSAETNADREMVLQTFESFKNIPKTFVSVRGSAEFFFLLKNFLILPSVS